MSVCFSPIFIFFYNYNPLFSEPEWIEVVTELLLSMMSQGSNFARLAAKTTFSCLTDHVTPDSLGLITDVSAHVLVDVLAENLLDISLCISWNSDKCYYEIHVLRLISFFWWNEELLLLIIFWSKFIWNLACFCSESPLFMLKNIWNLSTNISSC